MRNYTAIVEKCPQTGLYVGYIPNFPGAHSQAETLDELYSNLREVIEMLLEVGEPADDLYEVSVIRGVINPYGLSQNQLIKHMGITTN